ncbi:glycosyltransferase family 39 protein [Tautonia sp. JC769]|uniref:glycosyltransferase family 39 protein n=1 Tax=Tautonia sp. JC769 TaxID=3232135 RepID=UPI003458B648
MTLVTRHADRMLLAALLAFTFGLRAWDADQPIVENYVGRQIPTAMVARNLERGSGFLRPQLDTGPFPNLFLVEPPIYAALVAGLTRATGWPIGVSGRLVSGLATTLGAWGLYGLVRRREGVRVALVAVGVFAILPVMIRYGRAVQPDALMLGTQLVALRCWDAFAHDDRVRSGWLAAGWLLLATSLAVKVTSAFILIPLVLAIFGWRSRASLSPPAPDFTRPSVDPKTLTHPSPPHAGEKVAAGRVRGPSASSPSLATSPETPHPGPLPARGERVMEPSQPSPPPGERVAAGRVRGAAAPSHRDGTTATPHGPTRRLAICLALSALIPVILWYLHASALLAEGEGSRASLDNRRLWLDALLPTTLLRLETYRPAAHYLLIRSFTPIGLLLAVFGLVAIRPIDRLWPIWGASASLALLLLAGKWHHEYYWMVLAPVLSVGIARSLIAVARSKLGRLWATALGLLLVGMAAIGSRSTWQTPSEWRALGSAAEQVRRVVPADRWLVAPEALLFAADRRGCRLEITPRSARRAAGEWGGQLENPDDPLALVAFYQGRGAAFLADLGPEGSHESAGPRRASLRRLARKHYRIVIDRPDVFVAELVPKPKPKPKTKMKPTPMPGPDGASHGN